MREKIEFSFLLREVIRSIRIIILIGVIVGLLVSYDYYHSYVQSVDSIRYGSVCGIEVSDPDLVYDHDYGDAIIEMIKSDFVLEKVRQGLPSENQAMTVEEIRASVICNSKSYGTVVQIYSITQDQELSEAICSGIGEAAPVFLNDEGYACSLIQKASNLGSVAVSVQQNVSNPEKYYSVVSSIAQPQFSTLSMIKKGVAGLILGLIIGCILIWVVFVLRGRAVYPEELSNMGIISVNSLKEKKGERKLSAEIIASKLLLTNNKKLLIYSLGKGSEDLIEISELINGVQNGIDVELGGDLLNNPLVIMKASPDSAVLLAVKTDTVRLEAIKQAADLLNDTEATFLGTLLL